jgi:hypothetical protein
LIARILQDAGAEFSWCTGNQKKIGVNIYGVYLQNSDQVDFTKHQAVIAISSPTDRAFVNEVLSDKKLEGTHDYCWFC